MAKPGFYNDNRRRTFPFKERTASYDTPATGPVTMKQLPEAWIVDCRFVFMPSAGVVGAPVVRLSEVAREGSEVVFTFVCDDGALVELPLRFRFDLDADLYSRSNDQRHPLLDPLLTYPDGDFATYEDGDVIAYHGDSESGSAATCADPAWEGFVVVGDLSGVADRLSDGQTIDGGEGLGVVEPSLVVNLANAWINSINLANADRTRAEDLEGANCADSDSGVQAWTHPINQNRRDATCLQNGIAFLDGYNVAVSQREDDNSIVFSGEVGAGLGEPCGELQWFDEEEPPLGGKSDLYSGSLRCDDTLRSLNGQGGPEVTIASPQGVSITPVPAENKIRIDVNLLNIAPCPTQEGV